MILIDFIFILFYNTFWIYLGDDILVILGIDPGLATVGYGVIEKFGNNSTKVIDYGIVSTSKNDTLPTRLKQIYASITALIERYKPDAVAMEELFFQNNQKTAIAVAEARGVSLLACIHNLDSLYEYTPLQIKQALTGQGRAEKQQVQYMVKAILNLKAIPKPDDAADALAVALCHSQTNTFLSGTNIR